MNPDFNYEQELGDEIMARKAAKQNLSVGPIKIIDP